MTDRFAWRFIELDPIAHRATGLLILPGLIPGRRRRLDGLEFDA